MPLIFLRFRGIPKKNATMKENNLKPNIGRRPGSPGRRENHRLLTANRNSLVVLSGRDGKGGKS